MPAVRRAGRISFRPRLRNSGRYSRRPSPRRRRRRGPLPRFNWIMSSRRSRFNTRSWKRVEYSFALIKGGVTPCFSAPRGRVGKRERRRLWCRYPPSRRLCRPRILYVVPFSVSNTPGGSVDGEARSSATRSSGKGPSGSRSGRNVNIWVQTYFEVYARTTKKVRLITWVLHNVKVFFISGGASGIGRWSHSDSTRKAGLSVCTISTPLCPRATIPRLSRHHHW